MIGRKSLMTPYLFKIPTYFLGQVQSIIHPGVTNFDFGKRRRIRRPKDRQFMEADRSK